MVMNGDSFCRVDFIDFIDFHFKRKAFVSMVISEKKNNTDYGTVLLNYSLQIKKFSKEKIKKNKNFTNTGIYLFQKEILSFIPSERFFSLENDLFPDFDCKKFYGFITKEFYVDIGTPESYESAKVFLKKIGSSNEKKV